MGQLIMRGNRIVMPEKLCSQTIMLAHEEHKGKQVEKLIRSCYRA